MQVQDLSGFNFVKNPHRKNTHIFTSWDGIFICESPQDSERFKHQHVIRQANEQECKYYFEQLNKLQNK
jgi:hypothetical protein